MELSKNHILQGGKYRIIEKIGQGGFAITYKANFATEVTGTMGKITTDVTVAIKEFFFADYCVRDSDNSFITVSSPTGNQIFGKFKEKLRKEATILSRLRHPNIVSVFDIFEENNTIYMVMEYIDGFSLKQTIINQGGHLNEATTLRYASQLCEAVAEIHRNNVLHLDIKPGNILIDNNDNVKLIDFGISKQYNSETHTETSTTPVGISKGFAPLEQYTGVSQFSPATDIYAIGATIYNMLSGQIPPESMYLLEEDLPHINGVSNQMWTAITSAMSTRRNQRPQSIAELINLLPIGSSTPMANTNSAHADEETQIYNHTEQQHESTQISSPLTHPSSTDPTPTPIPQSTSDKTVTLSDSPQSQRIQTSTYTPPSSINQYNEDDDIEEEDYNDLCGKWCVKSIIAKIIFWLTCISASFAPIYYQWLLHGDHLNFTDVDYFVWPTLIAMLLTSFYVSFIARKEYSLFSKAWWIRVFIFIVLGGLSYFIWGITADHYILQYTPFIIINILAIITIICYKIWLIKKTKVLLVSSILGLLGISLCFTPNDFEISLSHIYYDDETITPDGFLCAVSNTPTIKAGEYYIDKYDDFYLFEKSIGYDSLGNEIFNYGLMIDNEIGSLSSTLFRRHTCEFEEFAPCIYDSIRYEISEDEYFNTQISIYGYSAGEKSKLAFGFLLDHKYEDSTAQFDPSYYGWYCRNLDATPQKNSYSKSK